MVDPAPPNQSLDSTILPSADGSPVGRFLEVAASSAPVAEAFQPTDTHRRLAETLFESGAESFVGLAEASGVSRTTLWRILKDPPAVKWIVSHSTRAAEAGLGLVHARLLNMALTSRSPAAIELYLKRFDPEYKRAESGVPAVAQQFNVIANMSDVELEAFLRRTRQKAGFGGTNSPPQILE